MSFKSFSTAQGTPTKTDNTDKPKNVTATSQPAVTPDKAATDLGPQKP